MMINGIRRDMRSVAPPTAARSQRSSKASPRRLIAGCGKAGSVEQWRTSAHAALSAKQRRKREAHAHNARPDSLSSGEDER